MGVRKFLVALTAAIAAGAICAAAAATPVTAAKAFWYVNGTKLASGTSNAVDCAKAGGGNLVIETVIAGFAVELTATNVNCGLGTATIVQDGNAAKGQGTLQFTGVSVMQPAGCTTPATLTTAALNRELYMDSVTPALIYDQFAPVSGTTLMTFKLENCALAGTYAVKGALFGQWANVTAVFANPQNVVFNATTASFSTLTVGTNAAMITGEMKNTATNGTTSVPFGAKDS